MASLSKKSLNTPDETRELPHTKVEVVKIGDTTISRSTFAPGWKWSNDVKPKVGTESCQVLHTFYGISGRMKVVMDDGTEAEFGPGDAGTIPPGHDAWVVGDEPAVGIDFTGGANYAK